MEPSRSEPQSEVSEGGKGTSEGWEETALVSTMSRNLCASPVVPGWQADLAGWTESLWRGSALHELGPSRCPPSTARWE